MIRVEIVAVRDPDSSNAFTVFVNGRQIDHYAANPDIGVSVNIFDVDPGASGVDAAWVSDELDSAAVLSKDARTYVARVIAGYARREGITEPATPDVG